MIPSNYIQIPTEIQNIPITITAEQAALLAAQLQGQSSMLQISNPVQLNPEQSYVVSVNGELHYPVPTSSVPGAPLALVPLGQHVNMDWLSMQINQGIQHQYSIQSEVQPVPENTSCVQQIPTSAASVPDTVPVQTSSTKSQKPSKSPTKTPGQDNAESLKTEIREDDVEKTQEESDSPEDYDLQTASEDPTSSRNSPIFEEDNEESRNLGDELSGLHERITKFIEDTKDNSKIVLEKRLYEGSSLNKFIESMPRLNYEKFSQLVNQVLKPVIQVIPNAIINGVGPTVHECGSLFNFKLDENSEIPEFVWFHFSLSVLIGEKKNKRLTPFTTDQFSQLIQKLKEVLEKSNSFKSAVIRGQRTSKKLVLELANANAKATLLFNTPVALKRSFLIRTYQRLDARLAGLVYLFSIWIQNNPEMTLISNNPLCHLLIFFLQNAGYIEVLHRRIPERMEDVDVFALTDINDEQLVQYINKKKQSISVTRLVYECAMFYSTFDFDNYAIDVTKGEPCLRREIEWKNKFARDSMVIPCAYSQTNLASAVTRHCFRTFLNGLTKLVDSFEAGNESSLFENNLIEIARRQGEFPVL